MRLIDWFFVVLAASCFVSAQALRAEVAPADDSITEADVDAAREFGFTDRLKIRRLNAKAKSTTPVSDIQAQVIRDLEAPGLRGQMIDSAVGALIKTAANVLRAKGFNEDADEIESQYLTRYAQAFTCMDSGCLMSGDHPPMNEWLDGVHKKIHTKLGDFWCKYFHFHDIEIINYGVPVVFAPKDYELKHYKEHFAGEINYGMFWNFHGVAGVVTYWAVQIVCAAGTSGLGMITFACGPISGFAEHVMDKRIAPPVATRIWERAHQE